MPKTRPMTIPAMRVMNSRRALGIESVMNRSLVSTASVFCRTTTTVRMSRKEGVQPYNISTPRRVPIGLRDQVEKELKRMQLLGVISPVEKSTTWCAGMVVAPKKNGKVRICVDLSQLNKGVQRETYPLPRVDDALA